MTTSIRRHSRSFLLLSLLTACSSGTSGGGALPVDGGKSAPANGSGGVSAAAGSAGHTGGGGASGSVTGGAASTGGTSGAGTGGRGSAGASSAADAGSDDGGIPGSGRWVLGYWAVWQNAQYPLSHVKWSDMTHAALSFVLPRAPVTPTTNGSPYATLDTANVFANLGSNGMADFASAAHSGGTKALISLGGGGAGVDFAAAASAAHRTQLVSEIVAACKEWQFDGVDLDWEDAIDYASFQALVVALRAAAPPGFLITVPIGAVNNNIGIDPGARDLWSSSYGAVDQLNVMTYTGTGAYPGWVVWYFSPLLGEGPDHPFDVASTLDAWHAVGIPKSKLGLGVGFYGRSVGPPVTAALQSYGSAQVYGNDDTLSYGSILRNFYGKGGAVYHWDDAAKAPYLVWPAPFQPSWATEFPNDAPPTVQFLTYEDPAGVAAKGDFARQNGYGGVIIWTINEGTQFPYGSDGYANPLLDAVKEAFR